MTNKQLSALVVAVTAIVNVCLFLGGFTTTVSCTIVQGVQSAYAAMIDE